MKSILLIILGLAAGSFSGLVGVGGGIVLIPALVFGFGMSQQMAQGTTLAVLIPPVGILAAWAYYQKGFVDIKVAALICLGFLFGGYIGSKLAVGLSSDMLQKIFGCFLLIVASKMLFFSGK
jgi:uncharacterized protein